MKRKLLLLLSLCLATKLIFAQEITVYSAPSQVKHLVQALTHYQGLAASSSWQVFPEGTCLRPGESGDNIGKLRQNLILTGDFITEDSVSKVFDQTLAEALLKFQMRHNLELTGYVDGPTLEALNITPAERAKQIEINLLRWHEDTVTNEPLVLVNIPNFTLHLLNSDRQEVWQTKVIVGQVSKGYQTKLFESKIKYLVLNPAWVIPQSIINKEIIPILKNDPNYLVRNSMRLYLFRNGQKTEVKANTINWNTFDLKKEKIMIVEDPGFQNTLGRMKFYFPNNHAIYLHDTRVKTLFGHRTRAYSHGCIRVQNPELLGAYLLSLDWKTTPNATFLKRETNREKVFHLPKPVRVRLGYYTCWADEHGQLQFRKDIYGLDRSETIMPL